MEFPGDVDTTDSRDVTVGDFLAAFAVRSDCCGCCLRA